MFNRMVTTAATIETSTTYAEDKYLTRCIISGK
jgi:hypothetical protein